jgi:hypothetical protein
MTLPNSSNARDHSHGTADGSATDPDGGRTRRFCRSARLFDREPVRAAVRREQPGTDAHPDRGRASDIDPRCGRFAARRLSRSRPRSGSNPRSRSRATTHLLRPIRRDLPGGRGGCDGRLRPGPGRTGVALVSTGRFPHGSRDGGLAARNGSRGVGLALGPDSRHVDARRSRRANSGGPRGTRFGARPSAVRPRCGRAGDWSLRRPCSRCLPSRRRAARLAIADSGRGRARLPRGIRCDIRGARVDVRGIQLRMGLLRSDSPARSPLPEGWWAA